MTNSTKKGKRGERELARKLRKEGYGALRSEQVDGSFAPDLLTTLKNCHIEVKRTGDTKITHESTLKKWVDTAEQEAPTNKWWVVAWRPDNGSWHFLVDPSIGRREHNIEIDSPFVAVRSVRGFVSIVDPLVQFTVNDPDNWTPDRHV